MFETVFLQLLNKLVEGFGDRLADRSVESLFGKGGKVPTRIGDVLTEEELRENLADHLREIGNWSAVVHFFGMSTPDDVESSTLPLSFTDTPRKFRTAGTKVPNNAHRLQEDILLTDVNHYLIIGDPGAGKTTTMKRLVRRLLDAPVSPRDTWNGPLLAVLRDHSSSTSIADVLLQKLGLTLAANTLLKAMPDGDVLPALDVEEHNERLYKLVAALLDSLRTVVFLDGLDEVRLESRSDLEASILRLARLMSTSKLVVSTRSGDFDRHMEGFSVVEICALSGDQIRSISDEWLGDESAEFLRRARTGAARELSDRPLFLCQMLLMFERSKSIPDQPSSLSRQMVRLMLQDWDYQRRVSRGSRYSGFDTDAKLEFLSNLAFVMTFGMRSQRFTHDELVEAYGTLCDRFSLPCGEAEIVAREIETHTGIIVEAGDKGFEFSHLSIQEYLAADYVARLADETLLPRLYLSSPATLAVATARSSDPSRFLASLMHRIREHHDIAAYLVRLLQEQPRFVGVSEQHLGVAGLMILFNEAPGLTEIVREFVRYPGVAGPINAILERAYDVDLAPHHRPRQEHVTVKIRPKHDVRLAGILLPVKGKVRLDVFTTLKMNETRLLRFLQGSPTGAPTAS